MGRGFFHFQKLDGNYFIMGFQWENSNFVEWLVCGAKLSSVAIFLLIREAFLIICQGPLEPGIAGLSCVMKSKQASGRCVCHN